MPDAISPEAWAERLSNTLNMRQALHSRYPTHSADWWIARLDAELTLKQRSISVYEAYYDGRHPLAFATPKFRSAFGNLLREFADNFCPIIVDSVEERLDVTGFRMGSAEDGSADADAWRIWQANGLDLESQLAHREALVAGSGYVTVWGGDDPSTPLITVESASQVVVAYAPGNRRVRLAAWKRWLEDDGYLYATLYLPDQILKFRSQGQYDTHLATGHTVHWIERPGDPGMPNPLGVVPVVELRNNARILGPGESELAKITGLQDGINKLCLDLLVASEAAAFPARYATGLELDVDDAGTPLPPPFQLGLDRLLVSESPETRFGTFEAADLQNYTRAIETMVQHIASQSRVPFHYFLINGGQAPSGESIRSAEAGLVSKVRRKQRSYGESWEEVMRLAFRVIGDDRRAAAVDAETIWASPETRTYGELVDGTLKESALGVPQEALWEKLGYSPVEIARFRTLRAEESLTNLFDLTGSTESQR
jgi:hypothetical protein